MVSLEAGCGVRWFRSWVCLYIICHTYALGVEDAISYLPQCTCCNMGTFIKAAAIPISSALFMVFCCCLSLQVLPWWFCWIEDGTLQSQLTESLSLLENNKPELSLFYFMNRRAVILYDWRPFSCNLVNLALIKFVAFYIGQGEIANSLLQGWNELKVDK